MTIPQTMNDDNIFRLPLRAHWVDCDPAGIVYFSHFLKYFEFAEFELYRTLGRDVRDLVNEFGIWLPRVEVHCNFFHPVRWDDMIEVQMQVIRLTERSVTYQFRIYSHGGTDRLTEGTITVVCVDRQSFQATPFPPPLFELLSARLTSEPDSA
jgi:YbgC/YbaW family acyl-CoA thioester hydrolase